MKTIAFRVDSSHVIGTGHVMRCLGLAEELRLLGYRCIFVMYPHSSSNKTRIINAGFEVLDLPLNPSSAHNDLDSSKWLMSTEFEDAMQFLGRIPINTSAVVVDHYSISSQWHSIVGEYFHLIAIDDLANRPLSPNVLINYDLDPTIVVKYEKLLPTSTEVWLGKDYVPLRREFLSARMLNKRSRQKFENILVFMGGSDSLNSTQVIVSALIEVFRKEKNIIVIVGESNLSRPELLKLFGHCANISIIPSQNGMMKLYEWADLAIGGVGVSAYERAAVGLPAIGIVIAENQNSVARMLAKHSCSAIFKFTNANFSSEIRKFLANLDYEHLETMSNNGIHLFKDTEGCPGLARKIARSFDSIDDLSFENKTS